MNNNELYQPLFDQIYNNKNKNLLKELSLIVESHKQSVADSFYDLLIENSKTRAFLTTEIVQTRLQFSLKQWLIDIFNHEHQSNFYHYIEMQKVIGEVHARIQIPITFVVFGVSNLKQSFFKIIQSLDMPPERKIRALDLTYRVIDLSVLIFNDVYLKNFMNEEKNTQSLRHYYVSHNLAIEFEQSRSTLLHWHRDLMTLLYHPYSKYRHGQVAHIRSSKFGLWVDHRASLLFYDQNEVKSFQDNLNEVDKVLDLIIEQSKKGDWQGLAESMEKMNVLISNIDWLLGRIAQEIVNMENNKDPLTRLFTRRYLPAIIQHEISYCLSNNETLGLILVDVDYFKKINDCYGHSVGDSVLMILANILTTTIRPYDHVFRYGGEEFLIIINNANEEICLKIAEKIRAKVAAHVFEDLPILKEPITVSLGLAVFDKHPDYEQLINHADQALYSAKENGRNRVELYQA